MNVPKLKTIYICQSCGYESPKWLGRCPECGEWNSMVEEFDNPSPTKTIATVSKPY
jgi:DNA repair protein RadA/Sms